MTRRVPPALGTRARRLLDRVAAPYVERVVAEAVDRVVARVDARADERQEQLLAAQRAFERRSRRDLLAALELEAARSTAEAVRTDMPSVRWLPTPHDTLRHALSEAPQEGMALEFGVYSGTTLRIVAEHRPTGVYGFDSFAGLPEHWRMGFEAGTFAVDTLPDVGTAELVVGLFADVLPGFLAEHPGPVGFLHVDCDLYSSTRTVLEHVGPRLRPGSVVLFDEYHNYPGWQEHEHRAWAEYTAATGTTFEHVGATADDEQVSVRVTGVGGASAASAAG